MHDYVSLNGQIIPSDSARIAPGDAGFLLGAGLFETIRVKNRVAFRLRDHLARLARSAEAFHFAFAVSEADIKEQLEELLEANGLTDARVRLTISRGDMATVDAQNPNPTATMLLTAAEFKPYPPELYHRGMTVALATARQNPDNPLTGHKTTSYLDRLTALREAQAAGAGEALWFTVHENLLAEGCISNVFVVDQGGILVTAPLTDPHRHHNRLVLPGITRSLVLELAREADILPHERMLTIHDLLAAKEVFLTNAIMGVMPVVRVERKGIGAEAPGPITLSLREAYEKRLQAECS